MNTTIDFTPSKSFRRFKEVSKVKVNDEILEVKIINDIVAFYKNNIPINVIHKDRLYERWVTIGNVLHYMQRINHWMGSTKCNYVKAEIA